MEALHNSLLLHYKTTVEQHASTVIGEISHVHWFNHMSEKIPTVTRGGVSQAVEL